MNLGLFGKSGEDFAARCLRRRGYRIVDRNYHTRYGEVDIIAKKRGYIVFIEVKTRAKSGIAAPAEFVTASKRDKLIKTAKFWLSHNETARQPRFDVVEIEHTGNRYTLLNHIENAFGE